ncbi:MAG: NAD(+) synthase [Selenomonadaceae bacterium]|nr:NAD(+) synthase [Selenomonadaceae bacterium]
MAKIALAQIEVAAGQPALNAEKILKFIAQAKEQECAAIVFPASSVSGRLYTTSRAFLKDCDTFCQQIIAASEGIAVIFGGVQEILVAGGGKLVNRLQDRTVFTAEIAGVQLCFMLDGTPYASGNAERYNFCAARAIDAKCPLVYVNAVGVQNNGKNIFPFDGESRIYNRDGKVIHEVAPFHENLSVVELDGLESLPALELPEEPPVAGIYRALSFGVEKFLAQIGMKKVVIGISGGIDSAVAAALYSKILGVENVLLVNMPSAFNSDTTKNLSETLAKNLGCKYVVLPIQDSVDATVKQIESTPVTFLSYGSTEEIKISGFVRENIQARDRSSRILSALAAAVGGVFTCNANKAETTIGYATMYGDAAGFMAALADLWKFQIYELARYMNDEVYGREVIPQGIIDIVPSAELSDAQNVDEGKGDPLHYDYHDYLFRAFTEKMSAPEDLLLAYAQGLLEDEIGCADGLAKKYFPTVEDFIADLEKWWKAFNGMAVAKRIQSPPILALTARPFGAQKESQYPPHFSQAYQDLKRQLLEA